MMRSCASGTSLSVGKRTSVYLTDAQTASLAALGTTMAEVVRAGLDALERYVPPPSGPGRRYGTAMETADRAQVEALIASWQESRTAAEGENSRLFAEMDREAAMFAAGEARALGHCIQALRMLVR